MSRRRFKNEAEVSQWAREQGLRPWVLADYSYPSGREPDRVELVCFPFWDDGTALVFARLEPGEPTTAKYLDATRLTVVSR